MDGINFKLTRKQVNELAQHDLEQQAEVRALRAEVKLLRAKLARLTTPTPALTCATAGELRDANLCEEGQP